MRLIWSSFLFLSMSTLLYGAFYTGFITLIAHSIWPDKSNGSLIKIDGKVVGSSLIAQSFTKEKYFWPRPSESNYATLPASASNFGPTNKKLYERAQRLTTKMALLHQVNINEVPLDLVTTSGSGLDPHISRQSALIQVNRVIKARGFNEQQKAEIMRRIGLEKENFLGWKSDEPVNVLTLNLALDLMEQ